MAEPVQLAQFRPDDDQFDRRRDGRPLLEGQGQEARIGKFLHHAALQVRQNAGSGLGAFGADEAGGIVRRVGPVADDIVVSARCALPDHPADLFNPVIGQDQFPGALGLAAGFRNGGRGRQFQFHLEHVAIGRREELNRQGGGREEAGHRQDDAGQKPDPGPCTDRVEQATINRSERARPQTMTPEAARRMDQVGIIEPGGKGTDHGQGQNQGRGNREDHGNPDHGDELAGRARHQRDRREGEDSRGRGRQKRGKQQTDRVFQRRQRRLPALAQEAVFIHHDNRIIDQQAERDDEAGHRHLVQGLIIEADQDEDGQNRQRQGRPDDERCAPPHHEEEDGKDDQGRHGQITGQTMQAVIDIIALSEDRIDPHAGDAVGKAGDYRISGIRPVVHAQFGLEIGGDEHRAAAIDQGQRPHRVAGILYHRGNIGQADEGPVLGLGDGNVPDPVDTVEFPGHLDGQVDGAGAQFTGRGLGIRAGGELRQIGDRQAQRSELIRIGLDPDFLFHTAEDFGLFGAGQVLQTRFQLVRETREDGGVFRALPVPAERNDHGGRADILPFDLRRQGFGGQLRLHAGHTFTDQGPGLIDFRRREVLPHLKRDHGNAGAGVGTGVLDLGETVDGVLDRFGHQGFDALGGRAREYGDHRAEAFGQRRVFLAPQRHEGAQPCRDQQDHAEQGQAWKAVEERAHWARASIRAGTTDWPGVTLWMPPARIISPALTAPRTKARSVSTRRASTGRASRAWPSPSCGTRT